jgi:hypothetical protein
MAAQRNLRELPLAVPAFLTAFAAQTYFKPSNMDVNINIYPIICLIIFKNIC